MSPRSQSFDVKKNIMVANVNYPRRLNATFSESPSRCNAATALLVSARAAATRRGPGDTWQSPQRAPGSSSTLSESGEVLFLDARLKAEKIILKLIKSGQRTIKNLSENDGPVKLLQPKTATSAASASEAPPTLRGSNALRSPEAQGEHPGLAQHSVLGRDSLHDWFL